jgi:cysteine desulfurase/selenocysteine lyase
MLDTARIRADFPILHQVVNGRPLVYLDNAATSQKPRAVIETLVDYYSRYNANVHRGVHTLGDRATEAYEGARAKVARFINAPGPETIIFVRNTTEGLNLVAYTWGRAHLRPGDEIVTTIMEHHSNLVPWQILAREKEAVLRFVGLTPTGELDMEDFARQLTPRTRIVAVTMASNVLGTITPVAEIVRQAHAVGAITVIDAAQAAPHLPIDVQALDCDFLAFSGHKMLGPTGIGVLYGRREHLERMPPFLGGGSMIRDVQLTTATWNDPPWKFEAGTPNIADAIGLGAAVDYLSALGMENVRAHEVALTAYALAALSQVEDLVIYGPPDPQRRTGVISFNLADIHAHDVGTILDQEGIAIRAGHHCCKPLMRHLGVAATARASFYIYNTREEVDRLVAALIRAKELFGSVVGR